MHFLHEVLLSWPFRECKIHPELRTFSWRLLFVVVFLEMCKKSTSLKSILPLYHLTGTITSEQKLESRELRFSHCWIVKAKGKVLWDFDSFFRKRGLLLWLCVPNMIITKANAKEMWGSLLLAFPLRKRKIIKLCRFSFVIVSVRMVITRKVCAERPRPTDSRSQGLQGSNW